MAKDNLFLGNFVISGITGEMGEAKIEITFDINSDKTLSVTALNKETMNYEHITLSAGSHYEYIDDLRGAVTLAP